MLHDFPAEAAAALLQSLVRSSLQQFVLLGLVRHEGKLNQDFGAAANPDIYDAAAAFYCLHIVQINIARKSGILKGSNRGIWSLRMYMLLPPQNSTLSQLL